MSSNRENQLKNITQGILADDVINENEVEYLLNWIDDHIEVTLNDEIEKIYDVLLEAMMDGEIDKQEERAIKKLLSTFIEENNNSEDCLSPLCSPLPDVTITDNVFCFTGDFNLGTRGYCEKIVLAHGAKTSKGITKKVDYLVIGANESELWSHGSYGAKIEKAVEYREKGTGVKIISEEHFLKYIDLNINTTQVEITPKKSTVKINTSFGDRYIVFDLETTGFSPIYDEIIEIGAIKVDKDSSKEHQIFNILVKPSKKISKGITSINGIDNDMVANANTIDVTIQEFYDFIEDFPLVAHNAPFDMKFLIKNFEDSGLIFKDNEVINTLPLARKAFPNFPNHKLTTLIEHLEIEVKQSHRALDDSIATMQIYNKAVEILNG